MQVKEWTRVLLLLVSLLIGLPAFGAENAETKLRLLVYGATGKVGTHVVTEALQRGHIVVAVSRADFAVALIDEAESAAHNMQRFSVAY